MVSTNLFSSHVWEGPQEPESGHGFSPTCAQFLSTITQAAVVQVEYSPLRNTTVNKVNRIHLAVHIEFITLELHFRYISVAGCLPSTDDWGIHSHGSDYHETEAVLDTSAGVDHISLGLTTSKEICLQMSVL